MDDSEITLLTLIDPSRCFDAVDHKALLKKLELYKITTDWFRSYLSGHVQRLKVGESLSEPLPITIGTFQGTCLGPYVLGITSCHIPTELDGFKITTVRYADDTQLAVTGPRNRLWGNVEMFGNSVRHYGYLVPSTRYEGQCVEN